MPSSRNFFSTFPAIHILQAAVRPLHGPQDIIGDRTAAHRGPNGGCGCRLRKRTLFLPPSGGQGVSSEDCRKGGKIGLEQSKRGSAVAPVFISRSAGVALVLAAPISAVRAQENPIVLTPHRAVYDLKLGRASSNSHIAGVRGRILYDFNGNSCDGYSLQFRQVSELDSGEGKVSTSDLRSTTWEGGDAKNFKFTSENFVNQNLVDTVDGRAEHGTSATAVSLVKPKERALDIDASVVFPTEHMVRVIEAARAGKTVLDCPVYAGADSGDKVYNTLTVIGHKLTPDEHKHDDAAGAEQ